MNDDKLTRRRYAAARAREGIPVSLILGKLVRHVKGKDDMSVTQLRAAEILLKKAMPDLSATEDTGEMYAREARDLSREELERIARTGSSGVPEPRPGNGDASSLH